MGSDDKTSSIADSLRPKKHAAKDLLFARVSIGTDLYENCMNAKGSTKKLCKKKAKEMLEQLRKTKPTKEKPDEEEDIDASIYRVAVDALSREVECDASSKSSCKSSNE